MSSELSLRTCILPGKLDEAVTKWHVGVSNSSYSYFESAGQYKLSDPACRNRTLNIFG